MNEAYRADIHTRIKKLAEGIAESMGAKCEIEIARGYPYLFNQPRLTSKLQAAAEKYIGKENVIDLDLWLAAEDFSFYSQEVDACFYRLGTRNEAKNITSGVHTPTFDIDEDALSIGTGMMAWMGLQQLDYANHLRM